MGDFFNLLRIMVKKYSMFLNIVMWFAILLMGFCFVFINSIGMECGFLIKKFIYCFCDLLLLLHALKSSLGLLLDYLVVHDLLLIIFSFFSFSIILFWVK
jgi:hypothetical protein